VGRANAFSSGYAVYFSQGSTANLFRIRVAQRRQAPGGKTTYTQIADSSEFSSYSASFNVYDEVLDVDIYRFSEAVTPEMTAAIKVKFKGATVVFGLVTGAPVGTAVIDSGQTIVDASATMIPSGDMEGFVSAWGEAIGAAWECEVDDWAEGALTLGDGGAISPEAMASVTLQTEGTPVGDLTTVLDPDFPFEQVKQRPRLAHDFDSGHVATIPAFHTSRRRWRFQKAGATDAEHDALFTFWDEHDGPEIPFSWTPPGAASAATCYFVPQSLRHVKDWVDAWSMSFELEEQLT